jgi:hypothetical protein
MVNGLLWRSMLNSLAGLGLLLLLLASVDPLDFGVYVGCLAPASVLASASCLGFDRIMLISDPGECRALRSIAIFSSLLVAIVSAVVCGLAFLGAPSGAPEEQRSTSAIGWLIGISAFLQVTGTAILLLATQLLVRRGRIITANYLLALPSTLVIGAQVVSVTLLGSSASALAIGSAAGWAFILAGTSLIDIVPKTGPAVPLKLVLRRWLRPAFIRTGTNLLSNARTQLGYTIVLFSVPFGAELVAAVRLIDTGASAASSILERSWGAALASIHCADTPDVDERSEALLSSYPLWIRNWALMCLPALGMAAFGLRVGVPERWMYVFEISPPLITAAAVAAQTAWLEKFFEYRRKHVDGLKIEVLILLTSLCAYSIALPLTRSMQGGAWVLGVVLGSLMLLRAHASMAQEVALATSRTVLGLVLAVSLLAGLVVWLAQLQL